MDSVIASIKKLRDDVTQSAADAYISDHEEHFAAYADLKKQINQVLPRFDEIAKVINSIESGEVEAPISFVNQQPIPKEGYRKAFIESLRELGGQARVKHIMERIERKMGASFTEVDRRCDLPSDENRPRWRSQVYGLIQLLIQEGTISSVSKGVYKLGR